MIKLNICAARRPGMTHEAYARYLRDNHARLVLGTEPVARHLQSYVQQHVRDAAYGAKAPAWHYDSVSHICAASIADHMAAVGTREYKEVIQPDEVNFADQRSPMFLMLEEMPLPVQHAGLSQFRLLHYLKAADGVSGDDLLGHWRTAYDRLMAQDGALAQGVRRAVLNRVLPGPGGEAPAYSGMAELGFVQWQDAATMGRFAQQTEETLAPFVAPETGFYLLAEAVPVRGTLF